MKTIIQFDINAKLNINIQILFDLNELKKKLNDLFILPLKILSKQKKTIRKRVEPKPSSTA